SSCISPSSKYFLQDPQLTELASRVRDSFDQEACLCRNKDKDDGNFYNKRVCINTNNTANILESFKIIYHGKVTWVRAKEVPGWTPDFTDDTDDDNSMDTELRDRMPKGEDLRKVVEPDDDSDLEIVPDTKLDEESLNNHVEEASTSECPHTIQVEDVSPGHNKSDSKENFQDDVAESICSGHFKKSDIQRTGGSVLHVIEEVVKALRVWDLITFIKLNVTILDYFVMVRGDWVPNGTKLLIISVYAPQELTEKKMLWDYLSHVMARWEGEVVVTGDFNEVCKKDERFGFSFNVQGAAAFNLFISNTGLEEVPLGGCSFTWCHKSATKMSKLGRFLISECLMNSRPNISAITLDRYLSDHQPILMRETHYDYGPVPFRFFHYWFEINGFNKLVEDSWNDVILVESNAMTKVMKKLKLLKEKIRDGDKEVVNNRTNVVKSLQELEKLQSLERLKRQKLNGQSRVMRTPSITIVFSTKKRSQLAIRGILADGIWMDSPNLVKKEFLSHFKNRFDAPQEARLKLDLNFPNMLNSDQVTDLEGVVSKDEIKRVVWDYGTDKSPGLNGFTFGFYRRYWKIIESDVVDAATYFFHHNSFPKGSNSSFIALIPKTSDANMVKDFRPISLIGSMYKIFAKILANRLVFILRYLVNETQSTFVRDRQILDDPFILNEIIQWCKSKKKHSLIFKVDFEKAFDSVRLHISFQRVVDADDDKVNETVEVMAVRLPKWKMKTLSIGGRLTLLNSVLGSMPIYHMSIFKVPMLILKRMESIRSHFFNGSDSYVKKSSWVKWTNALVSKDKGGLGISSLFALNRALISNGFGIFYFKTLLYRRTLLNQFTMIKRKLEDAWHGDIAFKYLFPRLYALESCTNIDVASKLSHSNLAFFFHRDPRGGVEQVQFDLLMMKVAGISLVSMRDRWIWSLEGLGDFSVASVRKLIDNHTLLNIATRTRWIKEVPIKDVIIRVIGATYRTQQQSEWRKPLAHQPAIRTVKIKELRNDEKVEGAAVAIPFSAVEEAKFRLKRVMLDEGFFLFQFETKEGMDKDEIKAAPVWVKHHHVPIVAYTETGLSLIITQIRRPIMLDSYTSQICLRSWGRNEYARALIKVSSETDLMDSIVIAIPYSDGKGHTLATIAIEYELLFRIPVPLLRDVVAYLEFSLRFGRKRTSLNNLLNNIQNLNKLMGLGFRNLNLIFITDGLNMGKLLMLNKRGIRPMLLNNDEDELWDQGVSQNAFNVINESDSKEVDKKLVLEGAHQNSMTENSFKGASTPSEQVPHY
nr:RNA-directed DNA polymerase, eukaryota [Tanacetum cinerariifolium]